MTGIPGSNRLALPISCICFIVSVYIMHSATICTGENLKDIFTNEISPCAANCSAMPDCDGFELEYGICSLKARGCGLRHVPFQIAVIYYRKQL